MERSGFTFVVTVFALPLAVIGCSNGSGHMDSGAGGSAELDAGSVIDTGGVPETGKPDATVGPETGKPDATVAAESGKPDGIVGPETGKPDAAVGPETGKPDVAATVEAGRRDAVSALDTAMFPDVPIGRDALAIDVSIAVDAPITGVQKANIVFVLTDDLSWNLVQYMPHVLQMKQQGTTFSRYFVTDSLCCPSRSSIFTGKYPHNTTVFSNGGDGGGYPQFERAGNSTQTFASVLEPAGYQTRMMGKYLNGYVPKQDQKDPGWTGWNVAGEGGYNEYAYELNNDGVVKFYGSADASTDTYLTDVLSAIGTSFIQTAASGPFMLEAATFAPHAPYTPAPRHDGLFNVTLPRPPANPAFATANTNPPNWLAEHPALTNAKIATLDKDFNLRVEAVQAVDDMIAAFMGELASSHVDQRTYLFFSSDNGYHMGDHNLAAGKQTAFDHDINVPLIVMGPGVPQGVTVDKIVENIDLCPTFADIAGTPPPATADGHSLLPLILGQDVADWRNVALVEHHGPDLEAMDPNDPDNEDASVAPNSYEAIRMTSSVYVEYQDGEKEYYDLTTDPFEMTNTAASLTAAQIQLFHNTITAIQTCEGAASCWSAQKM
jgi:arylsulfatase A-like enzyme